MLSPLTQVLTGLPELPTEEELSAMCLAIPTRIIAIDPQYEVATVTLGEIRKEISLALIDGAKVGDYVLVHVGYALGILSEEEATQTLALMAEVGLIGEGATTGEP